MRIPKITPVEVAPIDVSVGGEPTSDIFSVDVSVTFELLINVPGMGIA